MKENNSRSKNTVINTGFGMMNKIIALLFPFINRTVLIYVLGIEYAGLNSLFSSILQVLNLAELGIGSAIVYCMYKPMAEKNVELVCALLKYIKKMYFYIGISVVLAGVVVTPFLTSFIKGSIPDNLNLSILYLIYLFNTVLGYFFFAYKSTIFTAGQKVGIISNINSIFVLLQGIFQIVVLVMWGNYYLYLLLISIFTLFNNIFVSFCSKKMFPEYFPKGELDKSVQKDISTHVKGLVISRVCTTTRNAFDSIFISSFIGLTTVAVYGNYYYIVSAIIGFLSVLTTAMTASVGNSIVTESKEKNHNDLRRINFIYNWIVGFCTACLLVMYQPFMTIWMGTDALFPFNMVILLCVYFYFLNIGSIRAVYHDAAGLWWEARYRAIFEALVNLGLNFVLTYKLGVFGTVLGTLISLVLINYFYGTLIVFQYYFKTITARQYFIDNFKHLTATIAICAILYAITSFFSFSNLVNMLLGFVLCIIGYNFLYILVFKRSTLYRESKQMIKEIITNILGKCFIK